MAAAESHLVEQNIHFLILLSDITKTSRIQQLALLATLTRSQVNVIREICFNYLYGHFELSAEAKTRLRRHRSTIRRLVSKTTSYTERKHLIQYPLIQALLTPLSEHLIEHFCSNIEKAAEGDDNQQSAGNSENTNRNRDNSADTSNDNSSTNTVSGAV